MTILFNINLRQNEDSARGLMPVIMSSTPSLNHWMPTRFGSAATSVRGIAFTGILKTSRVKPAGLDEMLHQLDSIMQLDDYAADFLIPTQEALTRMHNFLEGASDALVIAFPSGTIYADGNGGLRLEWIRPNRELRLVISASAQGKSYLYHEAGVDYGADYTPSAEKLGRRLNWLENFKEGS